MAETSDMEDLMSSLAAASESHGMGDNENAQESFPLLQDSTAFKLPLSSYRGKKRSKYGTVLSGTKEQRIGKGK